MFVFKALLLTHFYGKKDGDNAPSPGNSETPIDIDETDADLASVVKRRRVTAAQAQEERKQKEKEDRIRYARVMIMLPILQELVIKYTITIEFLNWTLEMFSIITLQFEESDSIIVYCIQKVLTKLLTD